MKGADTMRLSKNKLAHLEKLAQQSQAFAPVAAAIRHGGRYSDLTEDQQDAYARFLGYASGEAYTALLLKLAEIGFGEGLDEPLRRPLKFDSESERAEHIRQTTKEIEQIFMEIKADPGQ